MNHNDKIDTITAVREGSVELLEVINKYDVNASSFGSSGSSTITETTNLLLRSSSSTSQLPTDRGNSNSGGHPPQPILDHASIVGQSREAFDDNNFTSDKELSCRQTTNPPSTYVALLMVASALCLGLAQMVRILNY